MLFTQMLKQDNKEKVCLVDGEKVFTYDDLEEKSENLAHAFAVKIRKGDKVLLCLENPFEQLLCFFAIIKAGGICIFAHADMTDKTCAELMARHDIEHKITQFEHTNNNINPLPQLTETDIFLGVLSSGTTGTPKLVLRDHISWLKAFPQQSRIFNLHCQDRLFLVGSLAYSANLNACLHMLFTGGTVVFSRSKMPRTWVRQISEHNISALFMVPANYRILVKNIHEQNAKITSVVTGGAKIDVDTVKILADRFPSARIVEYYGASEVGHVSYADKEDLLARPDSVGRLFPGVHVQSKEGVIWVQSPYVIPALRPQTSTEDRGYVDKEGFLVLSGRTQDIINCGGLKIFAGQMENLLRTYPGILDAAVFALPDKLKGEKICAAIVPEKGKLQQKEIIYFCRKNMDKFSYPQKIFFLAKLPLNTNGKVDKKIL